MHEKLLIYEYDCLNSLFLTDRKILKKVFANIIIPRIVYNEFRNKVNKEVYSTIKSLTRSKFVILEDFEIFSPEYKFYNSLKKGIECKCRGKCESAAITIAKHNSLTILSNHQCDFLKEYDLSHISMVDLLINAYDNEFINIDEAEIFWSNMENITHFSGSFSDYYMKNDMEN